MIIESVEIVIGVLLLWFFGDKVSDKIVEISEAAGVPMIILSAFIVSLSTTLPEITTSSIAAYDGASGIAIGNALGSIIANTLLILGIGSIIRPLEIRDKGATKTVGAAAILAVIYLFLLTVGGTVTRIIALLLIGGYVMYAFYTMKKHSTGGEKSGREVRWLDYVLAVVFGLMMVLGARLVVSGSVGIADYFGISQTVVGLTIVAIGTSLPELTNTVYAAIRERGEIGVGNIFGANVMNALIVTGIAALIRPFSVTVSPVVFGIAVGGMLIALGSGLKFGKIPRWVGGVMIVLYVAYILFTF